MPFFHRGEHPFIAHLAEPAGVLAVPAAQGPKIPLLHIIGTV
jgi:hypothetical protein